MSSSPVPYLSFSEAANRVWWYPVVQGLIAVVIGVIVMANPTASVLFLVILVGILLLIEGIVGIVDGIRRRGMPDARWRLVRGVLGAIVGAVLLFWPEATVGVLAIIAGAWAIVAGILALVAGFGLRQVPGSGWGWGVFWGLLTLGFGLALIFSTGSTVAVLAWIVGLYAVLSGAVLVIAGFVVRSLGKRAAEIGQ
jgi:uncharacterized membrane protein HdeD (DUF308 family)